jgi:hypothetical protein
MTSPSLVTRTRTTSPKPHCAMSGLGMRIPGELPMRVSSSRVEAFSGITLSLAGSEVKPRMES